MALHRAGEQNVAGQELHLQRSSPKPTGPPTTSPLMVNAATVVQHA